MGLAAALAVVAGCSTPPTSVGPAMPTASARGTDSASSATGPPAPDIGGLAAALLPVGSSERALSVGGRIRMYRAYRPARLTRLAPLVVMLHGGLGSSQHAQRAYGWDALAEREGFVVLYPNALGGSWNAGGGCCGIAAQEDIDDVAFVKLAVADLTTRVSLDPRRLYAAGMSAGGLMAYRLACDTTLFAAIGPVAATQLGDCPNPAPMSILHVHGTADTSIPYDRARGTGVAQISGPAIPALHAAWRGYGRCGGDLISTSADGLVTTTTTQCPEGRTVELVTIEGGGHDWPGVTRTGPLDASPSPGPAGPSASSAVTPPVGPPVDRTVGPPVGPPIGRFVGPSSGPAGATGSATAGATAYDTTASLWAFFKAHGR